LRSDLAITKAVYEHPLFVAHAHDWLKRRMALYGKVELGLSLTEVLSVTALDF